MNHICHCPEMLLTFPRIVLNMLPHSPTFREIFYVLEGLPYELQIMTHKEAQSYFMSP